MRIIKFKSWQPSTKTMFESFSMNERLREGNFEEDGEPVEAGLWGSDNIFLQYTGLLDKNGKEIYEGDIIQVVSGANPDHYWIHEIATSSKQFGNTLFAMLIENNLSVDEETNTYTFERRFFNKGIRNYIPSGRDVEIIGNIYENPELVDNGR